MIAKAFHQLIEQIAEGTLTVGIAYWGKAYTQHWKILMQIAIMGKNPLPAPQFAAKWMRIFQIDFALGGFTDMRNHITGFDRIVTHQLGNRRFNRRLVIDK